MMWTRWRPQYVPSCHAPKVRSDSHDRNVQFWSFLCATLQREPGVKIPLLDCQRRGQLHWHRNHSFWGQGRSVGCGQGQERLDLAMPSFAPTSPSDSQIVEKYFCPAHRFFVRCFPDKRGSFEFAPFDFHRCELPQISLLQDQNDIMC